MKRQCFLLIFSIFSVFVSFAQKELSGYYYSKSGTYIEIKNNMFKLIMPNNAINGWYSNVMAEGIIKQVSTSFIELNTDKDFMIEAIKNIEISQRIDSVVADSIKVRFLIPYQRSKLKISISTNNFRTFELDYSDNNKELNIPSDVKSISFYISPDYIQAHTSEGLFYGTVGFDSMIEYPVENYANVLEIQIPSLNDSFFETYRIKGDYAQIVNDSIIWKGEVYKKSK